jgi:hypothetical protein
MKTKLCREAGEKKKVELNPAPLFDCFLISFCLTFTFVLPLYTFWMSHVWRFLPGKPFQFIKV